jgi:hypothetical protein
VRVVIAFAKITEELYREYNIRPPFHSGRKIPYEMLVLCCFNHLFVVSVAFICFEPNK